MRISAFAFSVLMCLASSAVLCADVAILVEPGMVNYGGTPSLSASRAARALEKMGVAATPLRAHEAADPDTLNTDRFSVLVVDYGNAFPLPAIDNLRRFHQSGGCLVMTGVPFCHPCASSAPAGWSAQGSTSDWGDQVSWVAEGRDGGQCVSVRHPQGTWTGCSTGRMSATPGEALTIEGWVKSEGCAENREQLFVRFFNNGNFVGQDGPSAPTDSEDWVLIRKEITVPENGTEMDVCLQLWTVGATVQLDDVSLTREDSDENLVGNPGFVAAGDQWRDLGHDLQYFGHDAIGMGTGSFSGPLPDVGRLATTPDNPLAITDALLPTLDARPQWLDAPSLAEEDEVIPIVDLVQPNGDRFPAAALIRHQCEVFNGARDMWIGQVASGQSSVDRFAAAQLMARGVAWCLLEKGEMSREDFGELIARLDQQPKPEPLPDQLEIVDEPRPWGDTFYPKSKPPARELLVVDVRPLDPNARLALTCLQGITSRDEPKIWLVFSGERDMRWLDLHKEKGYIDGYEMVEDWRGLFKQFAGAFQGAVIPDDTQYQGVLLACNLAGVEDLIVAPEALAKELGLEIKQDLRGRFDTFAEGMAWLWDNYKDTFNHHLAIYAHPVTAYIGTVGYDIQWRGLIFWITGSLDEERPGADSIAEMEVMARIFSELPPNIGMRGFPWGGEGIGLGEGGGVDFCGRYGIGLTCNDHTPNHCIMSGVQIDRLVPPTPQPAPPLERDKTYIALTMSDGDNLNTWADYFYRYFEHPSHGKIPIGWGLGPALIDFMPAVAEWYYEQATPADEFIADVSGIFYVFPQTYGNRYREREKVFDGFVDWTARYMERTGMKSVRPHGGDDGRMERYAKGIPFMHSIFADYARRGGINHANGVYSLPGGMPVFHALTGWTYGKDGLLRDIREQVGDQRPAFVNAFLHNWTFDMDALQAAVDNRDADMVFVTPAQLAELYKEARKRGWTE